MENQVENNTCAPSPKGLIVLIGVIFGALISFTANETFLSIIGGAVVGLVIAILFNNFFYAQRPSDR
ncbi:hypothetical protein ACFX5U_22000 [Sphingobacterium sp. SG20118]|uniref:hypothetical protein n=1 Tax=Sphingobacterium TaxID=28453 RepID=UPI0004F7955C|nr:MULTISPECIES: hypothetical protein [Sphingobacterium]AIM35345.1 hypothetical protein KO02_00710 [Sphingobacterium sp. ML3W]MDH5828513.1 hypothetical protein [Sphingobacterium faecium]